jgi:hypothetical protein
VWEIPINFAEWDEAFEQGRVAARRGRTLYDCPYREIPEEVGFRQAWWEGFLEWIVPDNSTQVW